MAFTLDDLPTVYDELRRKAREMSRAAPGTLVDTAGLHEALVRVIGGDRREWNDRAHFIGHCLIALRRTWIDHWRSRRRHHPVEAARAAAALGRDDRVEDPEEILGALRLLESLAADESVKARAKIVEAVECRYLLGMTVPEVAEQVGASPSSVKAWLAFFRSWALDRVAPERSAIEDAVLRLGADGSLKHGVRIADVARRVCLALERPADAASATDRSVAEVLADLRFFYAWMERDVAARGGRA
jgi:DNA-directed RNA polymerase specialized sigma24 family protein